MITTLAIVLYYFYWFVRPLMTGSVGLRGSPFQSQLEFPSLDLLDSIVFTGFAGYTLILAIGSFSYRSSFKPADVDVLFPTPVSPRVVLAFRMVRDYLLTLLVPLFLAIFTWKPLQIDRLARDVPHPRSSGYVFLALWIAFLLLTTSWVGVGYAVSLYVNRNDRGSELRKKILGWCVAVPCILVIGYAIREAVGFQTVEDFVRFTHQLWMRAFFFTATPAADIVMGPLEDNIATSFMGGLLLLAISAVTLYLSLKQASWVYDQAAVRGFGAESVRQLQRKGDFMGVVAEAARRGKVRVRKPGWFQRLRWQGFSALIWKDILIQWRSVRGIVVLFLISGLVFVIMPRFAGLRGRDEGIGYLLLFIQGFIAFMTATMSSQSGFTELLRRVDLQKPLPFSPQTIVLAEVTAKALPSMVVPVVWGLVNLALFPSAWMIVLAGIVFFPSMSVVICALVSVIVLLFPEIDDVSQRGFRGLVMLLGLLIVGAPAMFIFVAVGYLTKSPLVGSIPGAIVNFGMAFVLTMIGGRLYADFNASE